MRKEFEKNGKRYAIFHRDYGWAVYIREKGEITKRVGGFTTEQLKKEFPEAFN